MQILPHGKIFFQSERIRNNNRSTPIAVADEFSRYQKGIDWHQQRSRLFETCQSRFYNKDKYGERNRENEKPRAEEYRRLGSNFWDKLVNHKEDVVWLKKLREEIVSVKGPE